MNATVWTEPEIDTSALKRLIRRAADACAERRAAIPHLYEAGAEVGGETRYQLLWCLCQLERTCRTLAQFAGYSAESELSDRAELVANITEQLTRAESLQAEIEQIINITRRSARSTSSSSARSRRVHAVADRAMQPPVAV